MKTSLVIRQITIATALALTAACGKNNLHNPAGLGPATGVDVARNQSSGGATAGGSSGGSSASDIVSYADVKPIFDAKCKMCHGSATPDKNWGDYKVASAKAGLIKNRVSVVKDMPKVGKLSDSEIATIVKWVDGGALETAPTAPADQASNPAPATPAQPAPQQPVAPPAPAPSTPAPTPAFDAVAFVTNNCAGCHGADSGALPTPVILGQSSQYIVAQLTAFASHDRKDLIMGGAMEGQAGSLANDDQRKAVADYISSLKWCDVKLTPADQTGVDLKNGETVFTNNSCTGCHTEGNAMGAPLLEGQKSDYVLAQLKAFKANSRSSQFMNSIAQTLSDKDAQDVAAYIASVKKCN